MPVLSSAFCRGSLAVSRMRSCSAFRRQRCACLSGIAIGPLAGVGVVTMPAVTKPMQRDEPHKDSDPNPVTCKPFHLLLS